MTAAKDTKGTKDTKRRRGFAVSAVRPVFLCVLCSLCVLCLAREARAQQGGFAMPDPKEMSGIPRPVDDLPNAISVRLIRGSLSSNARSSGQLHVGPKVITVKTDENGRASSRISSPAPPAQW